MMSHDSSWGTVSRGVVTSSDCAVKRFRTWSWCLSQTVPPATVLGMKLILTSVFGEQNCGHTLCLPQQSHDHQHENHESFCAVIDSVVPSSIHWCTIKSRCELSLRPNWGMVPASMRIFASPRMLSTFPTPLQTLPGDYTEHHVENYLALDEFSSNPAGHSPANFNQTNSDHLPSAQRQAGSLSFMLHLNLKHSKYTQWFSWIGAQSVLHSCSCLSGQYSWYVLSDTSDAAAPVSS